MKTIFQQRKIESFCTSEDSDIEQEMIIKQKKCEFIRSIQYEPMSQNISIIWIANETEWCSNPLLNAQTGF